MLIAGKPFKYWFGKAVLDFFGWEAVGPAPDIKKYVLVAAPHTTSWDLVFTLGVGWTLGFEPAWVGKHTLFEGPLGGFFRYLGGVSVDRRKSLDQVTQIVKLFEERERMVLVIAPEGTRGTTSYWKSGFYHIARGANVPLVLGFLDYKKKKGGVGEIFTPGDNLEADVDRIRTFYAGVTAKHPHRFSNIRLKSEAPPNAPPSAPPADDDDVEAAEPAAAG